MKTDKRMFSFIYNIVQLIVIVIVMVFAIACGDQPDESTPDEATVTQSLVIGEVAENSDNPNHTYYYYLPSSYTDGQVWPVIYCFDAHGRGKLPVSKYKELAEKNRYILIGSNESSNGLSWEDTFSHINIITEQVDSQLSVDHKRIYALGFSGGARVAVSMAIYLKGVAGVIGCAAGFPKLKQKLSKPFDYLGIVGSYDFNYSEMLQLEQQLKDSKFNSYLLIFDGKHEWPHISVMEYGFTWIALNAIRSGRAPYDDSFIEVSYHAEKQKTDQMLTDQDHPLKLYRQYQKMVNFYKDLTDISKVEEQLKILEENQVMKRILAKHSKTLTQETEVKQQYATALAQQPAEWWKAEVTRITGIVDTEDDYVNKCSYLRLMAHLSLVSYLQCDAALKQDELESARRFIDIFSYIDPGNAGHAYFRALWYAKKEQMNEALKYLNKAMYLGFDDMEKLNSEELFSSILDQVMNKPI